MTNNTSSELSQRKADIPVMVGLLRSLAFTDTRFMRVLTCDSTGRVRGKANKVWNVNAGAVEAANKLSCGVPMIKSLMGLSADADAIAAGSNLSPVGLLQLIPDFASLRFLPYAPGHVATYGYLYEDSSMSKVSSLCPRGFLKKMVDRTVEDNLELQIGVEIEFVLLDKSGAPFDTTEYCSVKGMDGAHEILTEIDQMLTSQAVQVVTMHTESCFGQFELVINHSSDIVALADAILSTRQTVSAVAQRHGLVASFAAKVLENAAGNGMHLHLSCVKQEQFMAGVLNHLQALTALTTPTNNSFRRIKPGFWAGNIVCWGMENKEAPLRLCDEGRHFEIKASDSTSNPYLSIGAIIAAGLDGIYSNMELPKPVNVDPATVKSSEFEELPKSLKEAVQFLEADAVLLDALGEDLATAYLAVKKDESKSQDRPLNTELKLLEKRL